MTFGKASSLTLGIAAAFAVGVWTGPRITSTMATSAPEPAPVVDTATVASGAPAKPAAVAKAAVAEKVPAVEMSAPALHRQLKQLMFDGTDMTKAADGFRNSEQFATVAYASHNTGVPFVVLKNRVLNEGKTLTSAIRESLPTTNASLEVERARAQAHSTLVSIGS
ncbi:MAG: hypothetical protein ABI634_02375 [Acidobacteriota bacterium]